MSYKYERIAHRSNVQYYTALLVNYNFQRPTTTSRWRTSYFTFDDLDNRLNKVQPNNGGGWLGSTGSDLFLGAVSNFPLRTLTPVPFLPCSRFDKLTCSSPW